ncbi:hypothetical protein CHS0354_039223 [Potamilus streckersoni]|uniref:Beta-1,3-galactosyl-O-glycosyl-glycoprotein beta-1,6-N-acetylglucosaminyltransferase n=1 Tax=Potamilus streckersoni TaxID=2493646 RepID=A0AAE0WC77_9BIVA|nr:hypothetical protein CHS0354_039223 [Potamilus streckersoni]
MSKIVRRKTAVVIIFSVSSFFWIVNHYSSSGSDWRTFSFVQNASFRLSFTGTQTPNETHREKVLTRKLRRLVTAVDCRRIIEGHKEEIAMATTWMTNHSKNTISNAEYLNLTSDCKAYKRERGLIDFIVTEDEEQFPIAYSILMYQEVEQMERLLKAIYRLQNIYCIHVDLSSPKEVHNAVNAITGCFDNVFVVSKKETVIYAGFTRLQADINCMADLLQTNVEWKYFINLPSQQYPIKTNQEIVKILQIYNGANDIEGITGNRMLPYRFKYVHKYVPQDKGKATIYKTNITKSDPPHNISIVKGSAYGIFSRNFVRFIIYDEKARDFLEWCKEVYSPDEYYWATLNHNPHLNAPGGFTGPPEEKRWLAVFAKWGEPCQGKYVRGVCVFGVGDLHELVAREELFVNKFHLTYQPLALDCLEEWLYNRTFNSEIVDLDFYRKLPFILK